MILFRKEFYAYAHMHDNNSLPKSSLYNIYRDIGVAMLKLDYLINNIGGRLDYQNAAVDIIRVNIMYSFMHKYWLLKFD